MRSTILAFAMVLSAAAASSWAVTARAATCTNDIDCTAGGTACGTDVCSWGVSPHQCVPAGSDPGWCTVNTDCKCMGEGATCVGTACTFTVPDAGAASATSSTSGTSHASGSVSSTAGTSAQTSGSGATVASGGGGSSGGCSVAFGAGASSWSFAGLGLACMLAGRRRRRV